MRTSCPLLPLFRPDFGAMVNVCELLTGLFQNVRGQQVLWPAVWRRGKHTAHVK